MRPLIKGVALCTLLAAATTTRAAVTVGVAPANPWIGFMNVFALPTDGGGYVFGNPWGTTDLNASFSGATLSLTPNTSIARDVAPSDTFWWQANGEGNKTMDASFYVEDSSTLPGQVVNFTGDVLSNTLVSPYTSVAFIKDFAADYSSNVSTTVALTPGIFNLSLATTAAGHHIQYGFETIGPNANFAEIQRLGSVQVTAAPVVPEPSSLMLLGAGVTGLLARRRSRKA